MSGRRDDVALLGEIGRGLFLKVRLVYLQNEIASGRTLAEAIDAVNIHGLLQGQLLAMTSPHFGDGTVTRDIIALVLMLPSELRRKVCEACVEHDGGVA